VEKSHFAKAIMASATGSSSSSPFPEKPAQPEVEAGVELYDACYDGDTDALRFIIGAFRAGQLAGIDVGFHDGSGRTGLHRASANGETECVKIVLEEVPGASAAVDLRDNNGRTPLHVAAAGGRTACVELLLKHGADPLAVARPSNSAAFSSGANGSDGGGETPLDCARRARNAKPECVALIEQWVARRESGDAPSGGANSGLAKMLTKGAATGLLLAMGSGARDALTASLNALDDSKMTEVIAILTERHAPTAKEASASAALVVDIDDLDEATLLELQQFVAEHS
jgi:Ankyrin repeats (3 copies)/Bromodomain extra-terminal - transcription regulation